MSKATSGERVATTDPIPDDQSEVTVLRTGQQAHRQADGPPSDDGDPDDGDSDEGDHHDHDDRPRWSSRRHAPEPDVGTLLRGLLNMGHRSSKNHKRDYKGVKVNPPGEFSGKKRTDLTAFLSACQLYFRSKVGTKYELGDAEKVTFAGSYLRDGPRRWFDNLLSADHEPAKLNQWKLFVAELKKRYGEINPEAEAVRKITLLKMTNSDHVADFLVRFQEQESHISRESGPGSALSVQFYDMLNHWIRQMFLYSGLRYMEMDLYKLQQRALDFDCDYWDYNANERNAQRPSATTYVERHTTVTKRRDSKPRKDNKRRVGSTHWYTTARQLTPTNNPATGSNSIPLRPDGKLTPTEYQRRKDKGLCTFCGTAGHFVAKCPRRSKTSYSSMKQAKTTFTIGGGSRSEN